MYHKRFLINIISMIFQIKFSFSAFMCEERQSLIKSLPLFSDSELPCMYANHIPIKSKYNENESIFSILVKSKNTETDPLLIWLNGEYSSMLGLFSEIGPIRLISKKGKISGKIEKSFIDFTNILFVDFPLGSGFSVTEKLGSIPSDQSDIQNQFYSFIDNFFDIYPDFQNKEIILAGENFCGKFIPHIAKSILTNNDKIKSKKRLGRIIDIKKIFIGNGIFDTKFHLESRKKLLSALNIISKEDEINYEYITDKCLFSLKNNNTESHKICESQIEFIEKIAGILNRHEIYRSEDYFTKEEGLINDYLNREDVRESLNLKFISNNFNLKNKSLDMIIGPNIMVHSAKNSLEKLINHHNIDIILYSGMFDLVNGPTGLENFLSDLKINNKLNSQREIWNFKTDKGADQVGYLKKFSPNLLFLNIKRAGYFITRTQKSISYYLYEKLIKGNIQDFNNCENSTNCSKIDYKCSKLNNCSNSGECINGHCSCFKDHFGADCSIPVTKLETGSLELKSKEQLVFKFEDNYDYYIEFESDHIRDLHIHLVPIVNKIDEFEEPLFRLKSNTSKNIVYLHKDLLKGNLLQVKNSKFHKFSFKINSFATNYRRNIWGPGGSGFISTLCLLGFGIFLFYYIYNLYKRALNYKNSCFVITSQNDTITTDYSRYKKDNSMVIYQDYKVLPREK